MAAIAIAQRLGWFNVDAMLETAPHWQLTEHIAYQKEHPECSSSEAASLIAVTIRNAIFEALHIHAGEKMPEKSYWPDDALVPWREHDNEEVDGALDALELATGL